AALDEGDAAALERPERCGGVLEPGHAEGFQIVPESGLDRAFPTGIDLERGREARPRGEARALEPRPGFAAAVGERGRLQRLERRQLGARGLTCTARLLQALLGGELRSAQRLQARLGRRECRAEFLARGAGTRLMRLEPGELLRGVLGTEGVLL